VLLDKFAEETEGTHEEFYSREPMSCLRHEAGVCKAEKLKSILFSN
jgi:hypothetical protein